MPGSLLSYVLVNCLLPRSAWGFVELPVIDMSDEASLLIADNALTKFGAVFLPADDVEAALEASTLLFESQDKRSFRKGGFSRGFIPMLGESGSHLKEIKESFSFGYDAKNPSNELEGQNIWPNEFESVAKLEKMFSLFVSVAKKFVSRVVNRWPGFENAGADCSESERISFVRAFRYHSTSSPQYQKHCQGNEAECTGSSSHTDWGFLTLISTVQFETLEILIGDIWEPVKPADSSHKNLFLLNAGDYLALASNGRIKSPRHRVVLSDKERLSLVFFFYPNFHSTFQHDASLDVSLFDDQTETQKNKEILANSFGKFILDKWSQVTRVQTCLETH